MNERINKDMLLRVILGIILALIFAITLFLVNPILGLLVVIVVSGIGGSCLEKSN